MCEHYFCKNIFYGSAKVKKKILVLVFYLVRNNYNYADCSGYKTIFLVGPSRHLHLFCFSNGYYVNFLFRISVHVASLVEFILSVPKDHTLVHVEFYAQLNLYKEIEEKVSVSFIFYASNKME